jgi:hypothetical protein
MARTFTFVIVVADALPVLSKALTAAGLVPDVVYIDAGMAGCADSYASCATLEASVAAQSGCLVRCDVLCGVLCVDHHYSPAKLDIENCVSAFPSAAIVGDDWDYPDVQRAAREVAAKYGRTIHAEQNKCWTYARIRTSKNGSAEAVGAGGHGGAGPGDSSRRLSANQARFASAVTAVLKRGDDVSSVKKLCEDSCESGSTLKEWVRVGIRDRASDAACVCVCVCACVCVCMRVCGVGRGAGYGAVVVGWYVVCVVYICVWVLCIACTQFR